MFRAASAREETVFRIHSTESDRARCPSVATVRGQVGPVESACGGQPEVSIISTSHRRPVARGWSIRSRAGQKGTVGGVTSWMNDHGPRTPTPPSQPCSEVLVGSPPSVAPEGRACRCPQGHAKGIMMATMVRPTTGDGLHGLIAGMVGERAVDLSLEHVDLAVVDLDQVADGLDPGRVGPGQIMLVQPDGPDTPHRSFTGGRSPCLASTALSCAFSPVRSTTSRARQRTSSLAARAPLGGDPRLGELAQAHPVQQITAVPVVVLDSPVLPTVPS